MLKIRQISRICRKKHDPAAKITYQHNAQGQRVFKSEPQFAQAAPDETEVGTDFITWLKKNFGWLYATAQTNATLGQSYVYADGQLPEYALLAEYGNGAASGAGRLEYIWLPTDSGAAIPIGVYRGSRFYAIHSDHLNTPRLMTDDSNKAVWQWPYSAFGDNKPTGILKATASPNNAVTQDVTTNALLKATAPAVKFNLRYPGQYFDDESNLNQNFNRSYQFGQGRYSQSDPIGLEGGLNRFGYSNQNPMSSSDPSGLLSSAEALAHYREGTGTALDMDFSEISTTFVRPTDFPAVKAATNSACFDQIIKIDDKTGFSSFLKWLTVGNIRLRLQGTLRTNCDCSWSFSGYLKSFDDIYDFNASTHRNIIGETLTTIGRNMPGKAYDIHIKGAKSISQKGHGYGIPTCNICRKN